MSKTSITAIILCRNGQMTLAKCLDSVAFCESVIVGDDASSDSSIEIAKEHHADVIKVPAGADFAAKRNFLLEYARTDWVLYVDVDEIVSKELIREMDNGKWRIDNVNGYYIPRNDVFMGRKLLHGETAHTKLLRLAKVGRGKWRRSVHEVWDIKGKTGELSGELLHYSHPNLEEFFDKINRYTELEAIERVKKFSIVHPSAGSGQVFPLSVFLQLFLFPPAKFIQNYIVRLGFFDGFPGLIMAWMMSFHSLCVRIKTLEKMMQITENT